MEYTYGVGNGKVGCREHIRFGWFVGSGVLEENDIPISFIMPFRFMWNFKRLVKVKTLEKDMNSSKFSKLRAQRVMRSRFITEAVCKTSVDAIEFCRRQRDRHQGVSQKSKTTRITTLLTSALARREPLPSLLSSVMVIDTWAPSPLAAHAVSEESKDKSDPSAQSRYQSNFIFFHGILRFRP